MAGVWLVDGQIVQSRGGVDLDESPRGTIFEVQFAGENGGRRVSSWDAVTSLVEISMRERRREERIVPSEELFGRVRATVPARILDISHTGVQVEVSTALRPTVECDFSLPDGKDMLRLRARVRRCRAASFAERSPDSQLMVYRAGLEFLSLSPRQREVLERLVAQGAAGEVSAPPAPAGGSEASEAPRQRGSVWDQAYLRLRSRFLGEN
jgi:hypothetical protein